MIDCRPAPPVPADLDLRGFEYMPLHCVRLRDSDLAVLSSGDEFRAAVLLWAAAWHQIPASSLPCDDRLLAKLAGYGRDVEGWLMVKKVALSGFVECSDGRLYHGTIAETALTSDSKRTAMRNKTMKANARWGEREEASGTPAERRSARLAAARAKGRHTAEEWAALLTFCQGKCVKCGSDRHICKDHILPIYRDGSDGIDNIQPMCASCNGRKAQDETDYRPHGWRVAVFGQNASLRGVKRHQEKRIEEREVGGGARAREPSGGLVSREAMDIADELAGIAGHDPAALPPSWYGAAMRVQTWMNDKGWTRAQIVTAAQAAMARKTDGPPQTVNYFEKPIGRFVAQQSAPIQQAEVTRGKAEGHHARQGWQASKDSFRAAHQKLKDHIADSDAGASGSGEVVRGEASRLLPAARRGEP